MKKRMLFVFFCSILFCLSLTVFAADDEQPILNIYCREQGHVVVETKGSDATCLQPGKTDGSYCSRCGMVLQAQEPIPAKGHTIVVDEAVPVTCTSDGKTEGSHCSVCGQIIERQRTITSTGHHTVIDKGYPSTCAERGRTDGSHCDICGEVFYEPVVLPLVDHVFTESKVGRDCTNDGYTLHTCVNCGFSYMSDFDYAIGHQLDVVPGVAQTCTEPGRTVQATCTVCGKVIEKAEPIPPFGHQWTTNVTCATLKKDGKRVTVCSICGEKQGEEPIAKIASVKLSDTKFVYDKKAKKPTVTVTDANGKTLTYKTDYKLKYDSGRKKAGTYYVSVTFRGEYKGTKALKFKIVLPAATGLVAVGGKNQATLTWKKTDGAGKYVVYMALAKNGTYKKVATTRKLTYTVKNLTPGATYYFRIRPMAATASGSNTYGGYSKVKSAKIR